MPQITPLELTAFGIMAPTLSVVVSHWLKGRWDIRLLKSKQDADQAVSQQNADSTLLGAATAGFTSAMATSMNVIEKMALMTIEMDKQRSLIESLTREVEELRPLKHQLPDSYRRIRTLAHMVLSRDKEIDDKTKTINAFVEVISSASGDAVEGAVEKSRQILFEFAKRYDATGQPIKDRDDIEELGVMVLEEALVQEVVEVGK